MLNPRVKLVLDFLPLAVFFIIYKWVGASEPTDALLNATAALIVVTLGVVVVEFALTRKVAVTPLVTALVVSVFGGLSLWLHNDAFIKMKPTVINILFAVILFGGCLRGKGLLRHIMGGAINLTDQGWWKLSLRFGCFFLAMALLNEFVWRTMPTATWVNFKVFGLIGLTFLFAMLHSGFIQRFQQKEE